MNLLVMDADIASSFAKANSLNVLITAFSKLGVTQSVYEELLIPLSYGYSFPKLIFEKVKVLGLNENEVKNYFELRIKYQNLGKGELESIVICKSKNFMFASFDKVALQTALVEGVRVIFPPILFLKIFENLGKTKTYKIIEKIEKEDKRNMDFVKEALEKLGK